MSVLDGYNKYKRYIKTNDGYKLCSQWTSSNTVQMDDGNTLQTNLGAINGITDSLTATSSNIAASASAVKTLNDNLIKTMKITRTNDSAGNLYISNTITPLSVVCNTAGYYSSKLFKNIYNMWYVKIYHSDDDTVVQNTDIDITITYK